MPQNSFIVIHDEVAEALAQKKALVALESSVFCQGLPEHLCDDAQASIEQIVRDHHAIPATISVLNGSVHVGTSREVRRILLDMRCEKKLLKIAERDMAFAISARASGGTTVSATCLIAHQVGINVFATGGIGGVHRGLDWDISADIKSLATHPIIVVCAGIKSILDTPKTLELLEAASVPLMSYNSDYVANFYCDQSSFLSPRRVDSIQQVADIFRLRKKLAQPEGMILANPLEKSLAINAELFENELAKGLQLAEEQKISFQAVTPFLLAYLASKPQLETVNANIELLKNNAKLASLLSTYLSMDLA